MTSENCPSIVEPSALPSRREVSSDLFAELTKAQLRISQQRQDLDTASAQFKSVEQQMATEKSALKELEHLLILEKEGSAQSVKECQSLHKQHKKLTKKHNKLMEKYQSLVFSSTAWSADELLLEVEELRGKLTEQDTEQKRLQEEHQAYWEQARSLTVNNSHLLQENEELETKLAELASHLSESCTSNMGLQRALSDANKDMDGLRAQLSAVKASTTAPHKAKSGTSSMDLPVGQCVSSLSPLAPNLQEGTPSPSFSTWLSSLSQAEAWSKDRAVRSSDRSQEASSMSASLPPSTTSLAQSMPISAAVQDLTASPGPNDPPPYGSFMAFLISNSPLPLTLASPAVQSPTLGASQGLSPESEKVLDALLSPSNLPPTPESSKRAQDAIAQAALSPESRFLEDWLLRPHAIPTPSPSAVAAIFEGVPITRSLKPVSPGPFKASAKSASQVKTGTPGSVLSPSLRRTPLGDVTNLTPPRASTARSPVQKRLDALLKAATPSRFAPAHLREVVFARATEPQNPLQCMGPPLNSPVMPGLCDSATDAAVFIDSLSKPSVLQAPPPTTVNSVRRSSPSSPSGQRLTFMELVTQAKLPSLNLRCSSSSSPSSVRDIGDSPGTPPVHDITSPARGLVKCPPAAGLAAQTTQTDLLLRSSSTTAAGRLEFKPMHRLSAAAAPSLLPESIIAVVGSSPAAATPSDHRRSASAAASNGETTPPVVEGRSGRTNTVTSTLLGNNSGARRSSRGPEMSSSASGRPSLRSLFSASRPAWSVAAPNSPAVPVTIVEPASPGNPSQMPPHRRSARSAAATRAQIVTRAGVAPRGTNATRPAQQPRNARVPSITAAARATGSSVAVCTPHEASTSAMQLVSHSTAQSASASPHRRRASNRSELM